MLVGIGIAATLDQVVLHLVLGWHHFYDHGGEATGKVADGVFHLLGTAVLVWGLVWLWRQRAELKPGFRRELAGGVLLGAGGFQLWDGTVQHKLLDLHQVRGDTDNVLPYDLVFLALAVALLVAGFLVRRRPTAG